MWIEEKNISNDFDLDLFKNQFLSNLDIKSTLHGKKYSDYLIETFFTINNEKELSLIFEWVYGQVDSSVQIIKTIRSIRNKERSKKDIDIYKNNTKSLLKSIDISLLHLLDNFENINELKYLNDFWRKKLKKIINLFFELSEKLIDKINNENTFASELMDAKNIYNTYTKENEQYKKICIIKVIAQIETYWQEWKQNKLNKKHIERYKLIVDTLLWPNYNQENDI